MIKLLAEESHSKAFAAFYDSHADAEWVSSALLRIEVARAVARAAPALLPDARDLLSAFSYIAIDDEIVEAAMNEPDRALRSLDAIYLATARRSSARISTVWSATTPASPPPRVMPGWWPCHLKAEDRASSDRRGCGRITHARRDSG